MLIFCSNGQDKKLKNIGGVDTQTRYRKLKTKLTGYRQPLQLNRPY
jgi:hypothetical protein